MGRHGVCQLTSELGESTQGPLPEKQIGLSSNLDPGRCPQRDLGFGWVQLVGSCALFEPKKKKETAGWEQNFRMETHDRRHIPQGRDRERQKDISTRATSDDTGCERLRHVTEGETEIATDILSAT